MKELVRTSVNNFSIADAVSIEKLKQSNNKISYFSIESVFNDKSSIILDDRKLHLFLNGVMLTSDFSDGVYKIYNHCNFIGLRSYKR